MKALEYSGIAEERKRAGKPSFRFHDLRHTTASIMVMEGVPLKAVQKQLRHKSITTTERYAHLSPDYMQKAVNILDMALSSDPKCDPLTDSTLYNSQQNPHNKRRFAGVAQG